MRLESLGCGQSLAAKRNIDLKKLGRLPLSTSSEKFDPSFRLVPHLGREPQHHVEAAERLCGNGLGNLLAACKPIKLDLGFWSLNRVIYLSNFVFETLKNSSQT